MQTSSTGRQLPEHRRCRRQADEICAPFLSMQLDETTFRRANVFRENSSFFRKSQ
jgi:hypothetical protein